MKRSCYDLNKGTTPEYPGDTKENYGNCQKGWPVSEQRFYLGPSK
jgi:hypothetical protein